MKIKFNDFINEEKNNNVVYFFHPTSTYGTRAETQSIELINIYFDDPLIYNAPETKKSYYDCVEEVNIIVVLPLSDGTLSPKTFRRIAYAFDRGERMYYLHPQKYKIINVEELQFFESKTLTSEEWDERVKIENVDDYFKDTLE